MNLKKVLSVIMVGATMVAGASTVSLPVYAVGSGTTSTSTTTGKEQTVNEVVSWFIDNEFVEPDNYLSGKFAVGVNQTIGILPDSEFGVTTGNTYKLYVKAENEKSWTLSTKGTFKRGVPVNYKATKAGKYQLCLKVTDATTGVIKKQYWGITVKATPKSSIIDVLGVSKYHLDKPVKARSLEFRNIGYSANYGKFKAVEVYRKASNETTWKQIYYNNKNDYNYKCSVTLDFDKVGIFDYCVKLHNQNGNTYKVYLNDVMVVMDDYDKQFFANPTNPIEVMREQDGVKLIEVSDLDFYVPASFTVELSDKSYNGIKYTTYSDFNKNGRKSSWKTDGKLGTKTGNYIIDYSTKYGSYIVHQYVSKSFIDEVKYIDMYEVWKDARKLFGAELYYDSDETYSEEAYTVAENFENVPVEDLSLIAYNIREFESMNYNIYSDFCYGNPFSAYQILDTRNIKSCFFDYTYEDETNGVDTHILDVKKVVITDQATNESITVTEDSDESILYYAGVYDFEITYSLSDGVERTIVYKNVPISSFTDRYAI